MAERRVSCLAWRIGYGDNCFGAGGVGGIRE